MYGPPWRPVPPAWSLDDRRYELREPDTIRLAHALRLAEIEPVVGAVHTILAVTAPADAERLMSRILGPNPPHLHARTVEYIADDLVMEVTGWRRWALQRLWVRTFEMWPTVVGRLIAAGVELDVLSPSEAAAAVFATWDGLYSNAPESWQKWLDTLHRAPPRQVRREVEQDAREEDEAAREQAEAEFAAIRAFGAGADPDDAPTPVADSQIVMPGSSTLEPT